MSQLSKPLQAVPDYAIHLTSLLDLASHVSSASANEVLNATLLSVMGRLKVMRACVFRWQGGSWVASPPLCKGVRPMVLSVLPNEAITRVDPADESVAVLVQQGIERLIPLHSAGSHNNVLALGPLFDESQDNEGARSYLELVRMIAGAAVANAEMVDSLRIATKALEARNLLVTSLFESARDFTGAISRDELLRMLSYRLMGQLMVNSFAIFLSKPLDGNEVIVVRSEEQSLESLHPSILTITQPCLVTELDADHPLLPALQEARIAMITPMTLHGELLGVIATRPKLSMREFSQDEVQFLEALGNTAIAAIENSRLIEEEREKQRLEGELSLAASVQQDLLPIELPDIRGLTLAAEMQSSRQVGGDYYDVIVLDAHRTMVVIADVAGKGVPAAILMANVQAAINVLARLDLPLPELAGRVNSLVYENTDPDVFITMFLGILDTDSHVVEYVNAGHNPPILVSESQTTLLTQGGLLIGVMNNAPAYQQGSCRLCKGDVLVLYTDGVTEVRQGMEEFGIERLEQTIAAHKHSSATEILAAIKQATREFAITEGQADDTSLVVIKVA